MHPTLRSLSITSSSLLACLQHLPQTPVTVSLSLFHLSLLSLTNCFTVSSSDRPSDRFSYSFDDIDSSTTQESASSSFLQPKQSPPPEVEPSVRLGKRKK